MVSRKVAQPRTSLDVASERGFTLVEVTVILLVLVILSTIMLPQIGGYNRLARFVRVKEDLGAICSVIKAMLDDVGEGAIFEEAGYDHPPVRTWATGLLIGEGDKPSGPDDESDARAKWRLDFFDMFNVETANGQR
ncbi:MAG TPA: type II secretion system protein [Acidobacteriota bacterium]|nr:type II secretion system protein [Acidobacteriota bacterium]